MNKQLSYGKVILRALEPGDIDLLYQWENDSALWEVSNTKVPFSRHLLAQYIKEASRDIYEQKQARLIIQTAKLNPVGAVDLFDFDPYHQRATIGILIYRPEDRRQRYAHDAIMAVENYAKNILGIRQLNANISEDNSASISLFEKAGYHISGIKKQWLRTPSGWKDEWFFQKLLTM